MKLFKATLIIPVFAISIFLAGCNSSVKPNPSQDLQKIKQINTYLASLKASSVYGPTIQQVKDFNSKVNSIMFTTQAGKNFKKIMLEMSLYMSNNYKQYHSDFMNITTNFTNTKSGQILLVDFKSAAADVQELLAQLNAQKAYKKANVITASAINSPS
ncbi:MAG: hypothetical protein R3Y52_02620 [Psittacicella sp.]